MSNKVIIISGPTATGKSNLAIHLAEWIKQTMQHNAEIVNFDSLIFYKELCIGTAKPTILEQTTVKHHLVDISSVKNPLNAARYIEKAEETINQLHRDKIIPILVGGSGFYLRALLKGMYPATEESIDIEERWNNLILNYGIEGARELLKNIDVESYHALHANDHYRIERAIKYVWITGKKISEEKKQANENAPYDLSKNIHNWDTLHLHLDIPKPEHWEIIQTRTKKMLQEGLISEVQSLIASGFSGAERPLQSIGYKETIEYLNGQIQSIDKLTEAISISTRQLSKTQRTWFKKVLSKKIFHPLNQLDKIKLEVSNFL